MARPVAAAVWRARPEVVVALDGRFATPNWYQVSYPHTFLSTEAASSSVGFFVPRKRFQDNMSMGLGLPAEEEMALCVITPFSPWLSLVFPRRADHYDRYLTLRNVPAVEVDALRALSQQHGVPGIDLTQIAILTVERPGPAAEGGFVHDSARKTPLAAHGGGA